MSLFNMTGLVQNGYIDGGIGNVYPHAPVIELGLMLAAFSELRGGRRSRDQTVVSNRRARHPVSIQKWHGRRVAQLPADVPWLDRLRRRPRVDLHQCVPACGG